MSLTKVAQDTEIVIYQTDDNDVHLQIKLKDETVWLTQEQLAQLFGKGRSTIAEHIGNIFTEGELVATEVCREFRQTYEHGSRKGKTQTKSVKHYNLDLIISVGYRVKSRQGILFRQWATKRIHEYIIKGFTMDDERLKSPGGWDYFNELLARIRDIRASEKRFYQKVRDLFALSTDYSPTDQQVHLFFAEVQNKLLYAVTNKTAAEIVTSRADENAPNMALSNWSGSIVRKHDVIIAKNYLTEDEVETLNLLVVLFLDQAELRAKEKKQLTIDYWRKNVDRLLEFSEKAILNNAGTVSSDEMKQIANSRYEMFDSNRKKQEAIDADFQDLKELEEISKKLPKRNE